MAVGEKVFKLEIGDFLNFSLPCGVDQVHGFDVHALRYWILLVL